VEPGWYVIVPESGTSMPKVALVFEQHGHLMVRAESLGDRDLDSRGLYQGWRWGPRIPL